MIEPVNLPQADPSFAPNQPPLAPARTMITFGTDTMRFNYRIVGVAVDDGRVLLHRAEWDDFWSLPGGRAELREAAEETLRREMREELGVAVRVERLLWVVENFFGLDGRDHHELALYFLMTFPPGHAHYRATTPFAGDEEGIPLIFQWFPLTDLHQIALYPTFLKDALRDLPLVPTHVVHTDPPKVG